VSVNQSVKIYIAPLHDPYSGVLSMHGNSEVCECMHVMDYLQNISDYTL